MNAGGNLATERRGTDQHQTLDLPRVVGIGVDRGALGSLAAAAVTDEHDLIHVDAAKEAPSPGVASDGSPIRPQGEMVSDELGSRRRAAVDEQAVLTVDAVRGNRHGQVSLSGEHIGDVPVSGVARDRAPSRAGRANLPTPRLLGRLDNRCCAVRVERARAAVGRTCRWEQSPPRPLPPGRRSPRARDPEACSATAEHDRALALPGRSRPGRSPARRLTSRRERDAAALRRRYGDLLPTRTARRATRSS